MRVHLRPGDRAIMPMKSKGDFPGQKSCGQRAPAMKIPKESEKIFAFLSWPGFLFFRAGGIFGTENAEAGKHLRQIFRIVAVID